MPFNGAGTYSLPSGNPVVTGTSISSTVQNNTMSDIATALTDCVTRDGQSPLTANMPMGGFKQTNLGAGSALSDSLNLGQAQNQAATWGGTAGGTANALTIALSPLPAAWAVGQKFRFKAGAAGNSGATTIAITGGPAAITVQVNGAACVGGEIVANQFYEILVDTATTCQLFGLQPYNATNATNATNSTNATNATNATNLTGIGNAAAFDARYQNSVIGSFRNLKIDALGVNNYNCVITADEVVLENSSNQYLTVRAVNKTINANGVVGAPLSIMSARAASTWYYIWLWYNATNGLTATLDASNTAPTAPTGYASTDYKALLPGAKRTDASGSTYLLQLSTKNKKSEYVPLAGSNVTAVPIAATGSAAAWTAVAMGAFVPTNTAILVKVLGFATGNVNMSVVSNNSYATAVSASNPYPLMLQPTAAGQSFSASADLFLESTYIYWQASGGSSVGILGWEDN